MDDALCPREGINPDCFFSKSSLWLECGLLLLNHPHFSISSSELGWGGSSLLLRGHMKQLEAWASDFLLSYLRSHHMALAGMLSHRLEVWKAPVSWKSAGLKGNSGCRAEADTSTRGHRDRALGWGCK